MYIHTSLKQGFDSIITTSKYVQTSYWLGNYAITASYVCWFVQANGVPSILVALYKMIFLNILHGIFNNISIIFIFHNRGFTVYICPWRALIGLLVCSWYILLVATHIWCFVLCLIISRCLYFHYLHFMIVLELLVRSRIRPSSSRVLQYQPLWWGTPIIRRKLGQEHDC